MSGWTIVQKILFGFLRSLSFHANYVYVVKAAPRIGGVHVSVFVAGQILIWGFSTVFRYVLIYAFYVTEIVAAV